LDISSKKRGSNKRNISILLPTFPNIINVMGFTAIDPTLEAALPTTAASAAKAVVTPSSGTAAAEEKSKKQKGGKKETLHNSEAPGLVITTPGSQDTKIGVDAVLELLTPGRHLRRRVVHLPVQRSQTGCQN
jgi:hypothetical protein